MTVMKTKYRVWRLPGKSNKDVYDGEREKTGILISKRQNTCDFSPEFPDRLACVGHPNWCLDWDESSRQELSTPFTPTRAHLEVILSIELYRGFILQSGIVQLNVLKLRAIQIAVLSSSVAAHMPWVTVLTMYFLPLQTAPWTVSSRPASGWFATCAHGFLGLVKMSCYLQGCVSAHSVPGPASPAFSAADSRRLLLKDFVSHPPVSQDSLYLNFGN